MNPEKLEISVALQIQKPINEVFEAGSKWLSGNSFDWFNLLACLKAYLEYGINLQKDAFTFMKNNYC